MALNTMNDYIDAGIFPRDWSLALQGELQAFTEAAGEVVNKAALSALDETATKGKEMLRAEVRRAGLAREGAQLGKGSGRSLANAIRSDVFPNKGDPRGPAALIYIQPSAIKIYRSFEEGLRITPRDGKYLAIPIPGSPASREEFGGLGGRKAGGMTVLDKFRQRGIEMAVVPARNGRPAMLVANNVRLSAAGKLSPIKRRKEGLPEQAWKASSKKGFNYAKGSASVPLFFLVEHAQMPKRLRLRDGFKAIGDTFFVTFAREFALAVSRVEAAKRQTAEVG